MSVTSYSREKSDLRKHIVLVILFLTVFPAVAQPLAGYDSVRLADTRDAYIDFEMLGSSSRRLPFWQSSNQWGTVPSSAPAAMLGTGIDFRNAVVRKPSGKAVLTFLAGAEVVAIASRKPEILLPQAYAGIAFKGLELTIGRWKQYVGLSDYSLGTGSYIWAGNALPLPKIQIGFRNYTAVPFTRQFLAFKGFYSDGIFENNRAVTNNLKLHNKSFYLRIGQPKSVIKLHGGFNHAVQWGGRTPYHTENGQMPRGFKNYVNVVTGLKPHGRLANASAFDNGNRVGNHVASVDLAAELDLKKVHVFLYRQNVVEDGSLFYLNNIKDGLNGVSISIKDQQRSGFTIHRIVAEFLYTKSQGGDKMEPGSHIRGNDDYFNNGQVRDGWSYHGRALGTPFITPGTDNDWAAYADFFTNNNRVWVAHIGLQGNAGAILWSSKLSYSDNDGSYAAPFSGQVSQFSGLLSVQKSVSWFGSSMLKASVFADNGKLFRNAVGVQLGIRKNGLIRKRDMPVQYAREANQIAYR
ncbi:capsule assembly Wzi family protein [Dyadobacter sp. Leaf189]|uniref:capsule assembly Wzi family protein n=1 Tax=Dyadobacter sp. Leaf189 TaxID=1736295 RepID=UPI0006FF0AAA|nr:capsule assembly Wzi family protein [Dyadobacter sp. Leaf189]KQS27044.1 hypothetical protein ASG33_21150 [Dyadobacter sp. Leaf189]